MTTNTSRCATEIIVFAALALEVNHAHLSAANAHPPPRAFVRARRRSNTSNASDRYSEDGIDRATLRKPYRQQLLVRTVPPLKVR
ncbi:unnamed protein product, partial [Iphiclides podalirius]